MALRPRTKYQNERAAAIALASIEHFFGGNMSNINRIVNFEGKEYIGVAYLGLGCDGCAARSSRADPHTETPLCRAVGCCFGVIYVERPPVPTGYVPHGTSYTKRDDGGVRRTDPDTAVAAAAKVKAPTLKQLIVGYLAANAFGGTGKEISAATNKPLNSITPRFKGLVDSGIIKDTGFIRDGQTVWALV